MKKKVVLLGLLLIVVVSLGVWAVKSIFFPGASAQATVRDFLIQYYSIPDHAFYTERLKASSQGAIEAIDETYRPFLTEAYLDTFQANREGYDLEAWAYANGYTLAIDQLDLSPTSTGTQGNTTFLQYDVTLTVTRESDKALATVEQSGLINVDKAKSGYRVSAWQKLNEKDLLYEELYAR